MKPLERILIWLLTSALVVLVVVQLMSLYVAPVHNSYLWWGDESWLMAEYHAQVTTGVFRHPQAYGSSLWIGNPFPFTAMWITSGLYGGASMLFPINTVDAGRTLTAVISLVLLASVYLVSRKLSANSILALAMTCLLASSRTFLLTSHSARYDILTALALLAILYLVWQRIETPKTTQIVIGMILGGSLMISVHVPILLLLPMLYIAYLHRARLKTLFVIGGCATAMIGVLYLLHMSTQPGLSGESNLSENLRTIPILRPFSLSVQSSNLVQKLDLLWEFAPQALLLMMFAIIGLFLSSARRQIAFYLLPVLGWLLLEPAGPSSYLIHFLPACAIAAIICARGFESKTGVRVAVALIALVSMGLGVRDASMAKEVGSSLTEKNKAAVAQVALHSSGLTVVAMNPAISFIDTAATTHFVELPDTRATLPESEGLLVTYNSSIMPGFMWEVNPLRREVTEPDLLLTGQFLDVGRSYFLPLDPRSDTMFVQRVDLNALYRRHIR